ncbi:MAG: maltose alpha-D-glucosyltransferase [Mycobacteriales bacterium]
MGSSQLCAAGPLRIACPRLYGATTRNNTVSESALSPESGGDPRWYQRAVFYEVLVRGFADSDNDGTGDLRGLCQRLDYLAWLGIDCIWLLPIYASPLRDGGYDISDFMSILPEYGDLGDFVTLVEEAHRRGIRVVADLVMNHTSDQHPWFQASRSDPEGPFGDFYVWSDTDDRYQGARVIFVDTEKSNWSFDPVRGQYFWHRFFSHQPDLNYENPAVQDAMIEVLRFWLDLGIDGFRLDAVPYLYEAEETNCENLPATHAYLKRIRKEVDALYPGTVLLAEANQWPADVVEYFGTGDECHMAFHFPLMPRIFMAVRREQRYPISEILAQTPDIPSTCQWGIFLRNHDELTLEMVTDEERDYMYTEYAKDPRMKANIGIRRRLAPLLDNSREQMELFTALLLSLPGSPVIYYGDEIGMGDNIYLGDRDGVRTPMQWSPDRNAGFSKCDPQRLYLPVIMDPVYGYASLNVEAEMRQATSLLNWTRRMIEVRKRHPAFGLGAYGELSSSNPSVLAFVREFGDDVVLCVNNLSRFAQPVELDLRRFQERTPIELMGSVHFPRIGELPYLLTLSGHGFYWFLLSTVEE